VAAATRAELLQVQPREGLARKWSGEHRSPPGGFGGLQIPPARGGSCPREARESCGGRAVPGRASSGPRGGPLVTRFEISQVQSLPLPCASAWCLPAEAEASCGRAPGGSSDWDHEGDLHGSGKSDTEVPPVAPGAARSCPPGADPIPARPGRRRRAHRSWAGIPDSTGVMQVQIRERFMCLAGTWLQSAHLPPY
jgi:hypothetical protein